MKRVLLLLLVPGAVFATALPSPFAADGSGQWVWLPDGKGSGYLNGDFGGGSVTINGCMITTPGQQGTEYDTGETAQTSDVVVPIDIGGPGWVRFVLASSTAPDLDYEIRPNSTSSNNWNPTQFDCDD